MQITKQVKAPRKQRKQLFTAPAHQRHKLMAAPLAPDLIASKGVKALPVRKGDTIRVMRGDHKGFEGKISRVDLKNYHVYVEGLTREKVDGTTIFVSIHPSKIMIKTLNLDDKWRKAVVERKQALLKKEVKKVSKKAVAKEEKPVEKAAKDVEAKRKLPAKMKQEKPAEAKVKAPPKMKAEKPAEEKAAPIEVAKPKVATKLSEKVEKEKKPVRKRVKAAAAKKPAAAPVESKEERAAIEVQKVVKKPRTPVKKTTVKKTPAKSKTKAEKEGGT